MNTYFDATPWTSSVRTIGSMLAQRPLIQAMQQQRQQQTRLMDAQTQGQLADTELTRARTKETTTKTSRQELQLASAMRLQRIMEQPGAISTDSAGNITLSAPAIQQAMGELAGMGESATDASSGMGNLFAKMNQPAQFREKLASDEKIRTENNIRDNETRANRPIVAGSGATVIDPQTLEPMAEAAYTLAPGQNRFPARVVGGLIDSQTNQPAKPIGQGQPMQPKSSATEQIRARLLADMLKGQTEAPQMLKNLQVFDAQTGAHPVTSSQAATPPEAASSAQPIPGEGTIIRSKKTGQLFVIKNGQPVPYQQ